MTGSTMQNAALLWHVSLLVPPERKVNWALPGAWVWVALLAAIFVVGLGLLWQAKRTEHSYV